jgi:hypothetical protein
VSGDVALFLFLMVGLKIPLGALLWLVWYASKAPEDDNAEDDNNNGGSDRRHGKEGPHAPTPPRRGPHGDPLPLPPQRVRVAKGRRVRHGSGSGPSSR